LDHPLVNSTSKRYYARLKLQRWEEIDAMQEKDEAINDLGGPLQSCNHNPVTGFFRDGCCNTNDEDRGSHTVCAQMTAAFLSYSLRQGNDLSTPRPEFSFPGLRPGDKWCLCAARWLEAYEEGSAPKVYLSSTHQRALEMIPIELLEEHAIDLN
jgi:uncharacterized protein (DUF2237 family)